MVSSLVCAVDGDVISVEFFKDLDHAYRELDRQVDDEISKLEKDGIHMEDIQVSKSTSYVRIRWRFKPEYLRETYPEYTPQDIERESRERLTVFAVFDGTVE